ncbi:MAG: hypothetical protein H6Q13_3468 [Bacteroidetes bacterium]|nr:hypothetical protein [Bacteroidota bacterium]
MTISYSTKGNLTYARFRDRNYKDVHLGRDLRSSISILEWTFNQRKEDTHYTSWELKRLQQKLVDDKILKNLYF